MEVCTHTLNDDIAGEKQFLLLSWFDRFAETFEYTNKLKIKRSKVFRRFVDFVLGETSSAKMV